MYLAMECGACSKPRMDCTCTQEEVLSKTGKVDLSVFLGDGVMGEVFKNSKGDYGVDYYMGNKLIKTEVYENHNELYAENAAENYTLGIKKIEEV
ncbi:MAG: hypothetical protein EBW64_01870 [Betaproteobacteria bacterium]|nr:hypothetical protein [Betaproteobacteria bacterium]